MNRDVLVPIVVCACCVLVLSAASASMESAVETEPNEVLNTELISLPFESTGPVSPSELRVDFEEGLEEAITAEEEQAGGADTTDADSHEARDDEAADTSEEGATSEDSSASEERSGSADQTAGEADRQEGPEERADREEDDSLFDSLRELLSRLLTLWPLLLVVLGIGIVIAHRDRLAGLRPTVAFPRTYTPPPHGGRVERGNTPVEQAWIEVLRAAELNLRADSSNSPSEWGQLAIDAGVDRDAVETVRKVFEQERFGNRPIDSEDIALVREAVARVKRGQSR